MLFLVTTTLRNSCSSIVLVYEHPLIPLQVRQLCFALHWILAISNTKLHVAQNTMAIFYWVVYPFN